MPWHRIAPGEISMRVNLIGIGMAVAFVAGLVSGLLPSPFLDVGCISARLSTDPVRVLYQIAHVNVWLPYMLIPVTLLAVLGDLRVLGHLIPRGIVSLFAAFILLCGLTHLVAAIAVPTRWYWLSNYSLIATAAVSWYTWLQLRGPVRRQLREQLRAMPSAEDYRARCGELEAALAGRDEALARAEALAASAQTAALRAEGEAMERSNQLALMQRQAEVIRQLSVPIVEPAIGVLQLALLGVLDTARLAQVSDGLAAKIESGDVRAVIVDLSGIDVVDTETAAHLVRLVQMLDLLGKRTVLTGIRPVVAQTMVALGVDLRGIPRANKLHEGIALGMREHPAGAAALPFARSERSSMR